ncbi:MAG: YjgN family protein [Burkholderiales bacterium]
MAAIRPYVDTPDEPLAPGTPPAPRDTGPGDLSLVAAHAHAFHFTGNAAEYFRIWVVNLFLSIVTLGLYSPWAKVRRKRYFYGNTWVAEANFDYHGDPVAILKGRIVAVLALVAYNVAGHYVPRLGTAIILLMIVGAPWLIVRTMRFNAANSSYRNLRFHFHGGYAEGLRAVAPFLLFPIIAFLLPPLGPGGVPSSPEEFAAAVLPTIPLVLFYPYVVGAIRRFQVRRLAFGAARFDCTMRIRPLYSIYFMASLLLGLGTTVAGAVVASLATFPALLPFLTNFLMPFFYLLVAGLVFGYTRSRVANLTFNATTLDGKARLVSTLSARKLGGIYVVNLLAIVATLGLAVPWAAVRTAAYRASCLRLECEDDLESVLGDVSRPVSATGEELGEFFDVDLSL